MSKLKSILKRSVGIILFAFIPGMAVGAPTVGWLMGGITGVATVFSSIIIFFGVQLAWNADISEDDIKKGFRAAVAKAAADNGEVAKAVDLSAKDVSEFDSFGDFTDLLEDDDAHIPNPVTSK